MINKSDPKRFMVQYLLGELSAGESAEMEDAYLNDSAAFQELVTVENELINRYLLGALPAAEREKFEHFFMANPARRETVETARSLLAYSAAAESALPSQTSESKWKQEYGRWGARAAAAAVLLIMLSGILWLYVSNRRLESELAARQREKSTFRQDQQSLRRQVEGLQAELHKRDNAIQQMAQLPPDVVAFTLGPGVSREGGETQNLVVPARASYVILRVLMENGSHPRYTLSIRTAEGDLVWRKNNVQARLSAGRSQGLAVTLPSHVLKNGDYVMKVSTGSEDLQHNITGYYFHVIRR